jgi:enoyl-CoA hydratase/carnithine racemase
MSERVTIERTGGVAHVQLNRPDKLNALDLAMFDAIAEAGDELAGDRSLRAVVLSGKGRAFCAGLDVSGFPELMASGAKLLSRYGEGPANFAQQTAYAWMSLPVPVIAAVRGPCFGGGLQIALGADIRLVSPDAELSVMEIKWGLIPDMTGTQTMRHLLRLDVIKELTFSGRKVGAEEAVAIGLATRLEADPVAAAMEMAEAIAQRSPDAVRTAKRLLDKAQRVDLATGLALEAKEQTAIIGSKNQLEAVMANMQRRAPEFADPEV